jgi:hypothetical protein
MSPSLTSVGVEAPTGAVVATDPASATPIATTALRFSIYLDAEGAMEVQLVD